MLKIFSFTESFNGRVVKFFKKLNAFPFQSSTNNSHFYQLLSNQYLFDKNLFFQFNFLIRTYNLFLIVKKFLPPIEVTFKTLPPLDIN